MTRASTRTSLPPPSLRSSVLAHAFTRLGTCKPTTPTLFDDLELALRLLAHVPLASRDILPLRIVILLNKQRTSLPLSLLLNATLAYPNHPLAPIWDTQMDIQPELENQIRAEVIPGLVSRLQLNVELGTLRSTIRVLLALSRASEAILAIILSEADYVLPALRSAYDGLSTRDSVESEQHVAEVKMDVLALCLALLGAVQSEGVKNGLKRLMGAEPPFQDHGDLFNDTLGQAVMALERGLVDDKAKRLIGLVRDDAAREDPVSEAPR